MPSVTNTACELRHIEIGAMWVRSAGVLDDQRLQDAWMRGDGMLAEAHVGLAHPWLGVAAAVVSTVDGMTHDKSSQTRSGGRPVFDAACHRWGDGCASFQTIHDARSSVIGRTHE